MRYLVVAFILINSAFCFAQRAEFSVVSPVHKFPKTKEGEVVKHNFEVKNTGTDTLFITQYKVACPCTQVVFPPAIAPGATGQVELTFDTKGKYYQQDRTILLTTNTKKGIEMLRFKVFVIPEDEQ